MKFENMVKQIISETKNKKPDKTDEEIEQKIVDEIEDETTENQNNVEEQTVQLDGPEAEFVKKFIEMTELNIVLNAYPQIISDFKEILGKSWKKVSPIINELNKTKKETVSKLKEELKTMRSDMKTEQEQYVNEAAAKLNILSLLDNATKNKKKKK